MPINLDLIPLIFGGLHGGLDTPAAVRFVSADGFRGSLADSIEAPSTTASDGTPTPSGFRGSLADSIEARKDGVSPPPRCSGGFRGSLADSIEAPQSSSTPGRTTGCGFRGSLADSIEAWGAGDQRVGCLRPDSADLWRTPLRPALQLGGRHVGVPDSADLWRTPLRLAHVLSACGRPCCADSADLWRTPLRPDQGAAPGGAAVPGLIPPIFGGLHGGTDAVHDLDYRTAYGFRRSLADSIEAGGDRGDGAGGGGCGFRRSLADSIEAGRRTRCRPRRGPPDSADLRRKRGRGHRLLCTTCWYQ